MLSFVTWPPFLCELIMHPKFIKHNELGNLILKQLQCFPRKLLQNVGIYSVFHYCVSLYTVISPVTTVKGSWWLLVSRRQSNASPISLDKISLLILYPLYTSIVKDSSCTSNKYLKGFYKQLNFIALVARTYVYHSKKDF